METATPDSLYVRSVGQRKCFAAQGDKTPEAGPAPKYLVQKRVVRVILRRRATCYEALLHRS